MQINILELAEEIFEIKDMKDIQSLFNDTFHTNYTLQTFYNWCQGTSSMNYDVLEKFMYLFKLPIQDILTPDISRFKDIKIAKKKMKRIKNVKN